MRCYQVEIDFRNERVFPSLPTFHPWRTPVSLLYPSNHQPRDHLLVRALAST
jgi:hypothetical protein